MYSDWSWIIRRLKAKQWKSGLTYELRESKKEKLCHSCVDFIGSVTYPAGKDAESATTRCRDVNVTTYRGSFSLSIFAGISERLRFQTFLLEVLLDCSRWMSGCSHLLTTHNLCWEKKKKNQGSDVRRIQPSSLSLWGQWEADLWERRSSRSAPECSSISSSAPAIEQDVWRQRDRCIDNPGLRYDSNLNSQTKHVV